MGDGERESLGEGCHGTVGQLEKGESPPGKAHRRNWGGSGSAQKRKKGKAIGGSEKEQGCEQRQSQGPGKCGCDHRIQCGSHRSGPRSFPR